MPIHILPTRRFAVAAGGKQIDAVIGTVLLKQFQFTIDYRGQALLLSKRGEAPASPADSAIEIPFYLSGDHYMVARGRVNDSPPLMFFIDTGMAGQSFTCPKSTLDAAGIVPSGPKLQGIGGGGKIDIQPFTTKSLSLGDAKVTDASGLIGPFPEPLELSQGFRIGGLISHAFFRDYTVQFDFDSMKLRLSQ